MSQDTFELQRFVDAQNPVYPAVLAELRSGRKRSHWMWFVFPQIIGLGHSAMAQHYAIRSRDEAGAYLAHPVLGPRLDACTDLVLGLEDLSAHQVFGSPDDVKFRSSMTLFAEVATGTSRFHDALQRYFGGVGDDATRTQLARLQDEPGGSHADHL